MACSHRDSSAAIVTSQPMHSRGEFESIPVKTKQDGSKAKPHGMRDSVHVDPEHVWGDEGPVNE
jgi:hypothetical protein